MIRKRLTYANVVSTLALFIALGLGGAYAASKITSKDLAKGSVKSKAIKDKTIVGKDVKDGKLSGADIADHSIAEADVAATRTITPTLSNGGQNDCIWVDGASSSLGTAPVQVRRSATGEISFDGIAQPIDGPGGDGACSGAGPDASEDSQVFTLPAAFTPAATHVFANPAGGSIIVIAGLNGATLGATVLPPGAVATAVSGSAFFDEISFLAADADSVAATRAPARFSLKDLRAP